MRRRQRKSDCPVHFALEVFGDAWTLLIIRDLMFKGKTTYGQFLLGGEGIATNVLADRLLRLEEDGIIQKQSQGAKVLYRLTPKGIDLAPVILDIIEWSAKYDPQTAAEPEFIRKLNRDRTGLEAEIREALRVNKGAGRAAILSARTRKSAKSGRKVAHDRP